MLDELLADWIDNTAQAPLNRSVREFIEWSYRQTIEPDLPRGQQYDEAGDATVDDNARACSSAESGAAATPLSDEDVRAIAAYVGIRGDHVTRLLGLLRLISADIKVSHSKAL